MPMNEPMDMADKPSKPGKPKMRVSAHMSSYPGGADKSYLKDRHSRLKAEIAATKKEIADWNAEAVAAQALKSIKADLMRLQSDLLGCEAEMDEAGDASYEEGEEDDEADEADEPAEKDEAEEK